MVVQSNISALFASNCLQKTTGKWSKSTEKLSSGYKINRAADDAAGLSISEKMRWQIRGLNKAAQNIEDGMSYCNVAEGALSEVHSMLDRIKELSVQAASDVNTEDDRKAIDSEVQQLNNQVTDILRNTTFNSMKIWQASYVPDVDGQANDFSFYNVKDSTGSYVGGITYMGHRYSWADLGMSGEWNGTTHTFSSNKEYSVSLPANNGNTATFKLRTTAGCTGNEVVKTYSWSADDTGIRIDGVLVNGNPPEAGNTTWAAMGLTPGNYVEGGTYKFTYYGMEIQFDVPQVGAEWPDFKDGFGNPRVELNWHSQYVNSTRYEVASLSNTSNTIKINSANKNYISTSNNPYEVKADKDGIWIVNNMSNSSALSGLSKDGNASTYSTFVAWQDLVAKDAGGNAISGIESWGVDTNNNSGSKSDKNDATANTTVSNNDNGMNSSIVEDGAKYTYNMGTLFSDAAAGTGFGFDITMFDNASLGGTISDINNTVYTNLGIDSPTKVETAGTGYTGALSVSASQSYFSFETQRDSFGRAYASDSELIVAATSNDMNINAATDTYELAIGTQGYKLTSLETSTDFKNKIKDKIVDSMKAIANSTGLTDDEKLDSLLNLGTYTLHMKNGSEGFDINVDFSNVKYKDISNTIIANDAAGNITSAANDYLDNELGNSTNGLFANTNYNISGNGASYQSLGIVQNYVSEPDAQNCAMVEGLKLSLTLQIGAKEGQTMKVEYDYLRLPNLGMKGVNVLSQENASSTISRTDNAIKLISEQRTLFGAYTNRLSHAYSVDKITAENTQAAESRIRDTDIAEEMTEYSKNNILIQAGQAVLAQANSSVQGIVQLLQV